MASPVSRNIPSRWGYPIGNGRGLYSPNRAPEGAAPVLVGGTGSWPQVLASGATETILTPGRIRALYDVDVDIVRHGTTGFAVVPAVAPNGRGGSKP